MTKKKLFFFGLVIYQVLVYSLFLLKKEWGLGFFLFEIFHLFPFAIFAKKRQFATLLKTAIVITLSFFFFIRSGSGNPITIFSLFFLNHIIAYEFATGELLSIQTFLSTPFRVLKNIGNTMTSFIMAFDFVLPFLNAKKLTASKYTSKILVGSFISIPIIFVLLGLFQAVDNTFIPTLWDNFLRIIPDWIEHFKLDDIAPTIVELGIFLVYLFFTLPTEQEDKKFKLHKNFIIELITMNVLVASVFFLFFSSQIQSFAQMVIDFQSQHINPKLFVREGFYQLLLASLIGTGVSLLLNSQILNSITRKKKIVAIGAMTTLLLGVVFVSLLAGQRVFVYQFLHGLTVLRIWGMLLLVAFWIALSSLFLHIYQRIQFSWFLQTAVFSFLIVVLIVQVINIDYVVAKWGNPRVNDKTDWGYISRLSYDALPVWKEKLDHVSPEILGKCQPDYESQGKDNPQFPQGFPNTDVGIVECQAVVEQYEDEAGLVDSILRHQFHYYLATYYDHSKRSKIERRQGINCNTSTSVPWQSTNFSVRKGEIFLCEKQQDWEDFYREYEDLQFVLFELTHKQGNL